MEIKSCRSFVSICLGTGVVVTQLTMQAALLAVKSDVMGLVVIKSFGGFHDPFNLGNNVCNKYRAAYGVQNKYTVEYLSETCCHLCY
jgi:hypothetical protein